MADAAIDVEQQRGDGLGDARVDQRPGVDRPIARDALDQLDDRALRASAWSLQTTMSPSTGWSISFSASALSFLKPAHDEALGQELLDLLGCRALGHAPT